MKWITWNLLFFSMMVTQRIGSNLTRAVKTGCYALTFFTSMGAFSIANAKEHQAGQHLWELGLRPRVAFIEGEQHARASSLLLRARVNSEWSNHFSTLIEVDHVELFWEDEFSNGEQFNDKPVIPDVEGSDLNQALFTLSPTNTLQLFAGREAVNLGTERFVGSNSFWQNEQTLDLAGLAYSYGSASNISYRYVANANRISGDDAGRHLHPSDSNFATNNGLRPLRFLGDHEYNAHLLFTEIREWDHSIVQAYYFNLDNQDAPAVSNRTLGLRYEHKGDIGNWRTLAHAELAYQERLDLDNDTRLHYYNVATGAGFRSHQMTVKYEHLDAKNGLSFTTPLASLHDHNGWADQFLAIPKTGLSDMSIQYIWRNSPFKMDARYHIFESVEDGIHYGNELDVDLSVNIDKKNTVLLRFADFNKKDTTYLNQRRIFLQFIHHL